MGRKRRKNLNTIAQAAEKTGVPRSTLATWIRSGRYDYERSDGGFVLIHDKVVDDILRDYLRRPKGEGNRLKGGSPLIKPPQKGQGKTDY